MYTVRERRAAVRRDGSPQQVYRTVGLRQKQASFWRHVSTLRMLGCLIVLAFVFLRLRRPYRAPSLDHDSNEVAAPTATRPAPAATLLPEVIAWYLRVVESPALFPHIWSHTHLFDQQSWPGAFNTSNKSGRRQVPLWRGNIGVDLMSTLNNDVCSKTLKYMKAINYTRARDDGWGESVPSRLDAHCTRTRSLLIQVMSDESPHDMAVRPMFTALHKRVGCAIEQLQEMQKFINRAKDGDPAPFTNYPGERDAAIADILLETLFYSLTDAELADFAGTMRCTVNWKPPQAGNAQGRRARTINEAAADGYQSLGPADMMDTGAFSGTVYWQGKRLSEILDRHASIESLVLEWVEWARERRTKIKRGLPARMKRINATLTTDVREQMRHMAALRNRFMELAVNFDVIERARLRLGIHLLRLRAANMSTVELSESAARSDGTAEDDDVVLYTFGDPGRLAARLSKAVSDNRDWKLREWERALQTEDSEASARAEERKSRWGALWSFLF